MAHYIKCHVFKEVLMLKNFFPLNNCSFDFSANLYSPSAKVRQFWFFSANERVHTPTHREQKMLCRSWWHVDSWAAQFWCIDVIWSRERDGEGSSNAAKKHVKKMSLPQTTYFVGHFLLTGTLETATSSRGIWCCGSELRLEFSSKLWSHPIQSIQIDN